MGEMSMSAATSVNAAPLVKFLVGTLIATVALQLI